MIEAVLFDLGNTLMRDLATSAGQMLEATGRPLHEWLQQSGLRPPRYTTYIRRLRMQMLWACLRSRITGREVRLVRVLESLHRRMGMPIAENHVQDLGRQCMPVLRSYFLPDDDARPMLHRLRASGLKMGVVSNTMIPGFAMDEHLRNQEMIEYFPVRIYSSEVGYRKPRREIFDMALDQLPAQPGHTMFVGDHAINDVRGPARLGMTTVLLAPTGCTPRRGVRPDHVIRGLAEIPQILNLRN